MKSTLVLLLAAMFLLTLTSPAAAAEPIKLMDVTPTTGETHHFEVKPESREGYRIPYMNISVIVVNQDTKDEETVVLHPMFSGNFHYGANVSLKPGKYLLRFRLDPPTFVRGEKRKAQWLDPVYAEFVFDAAAKFEKSIKIGEKKTGDMNISFEAEHAEAMFVPEGAAREHRHH